jgi:hypothetical protein
MDVEATTPESSGSSFTTSASTSTPNAPPKPWSGLGYEMVPGLANRIIARYLRGQRKNMERFFQERGLMESAERMRQIRLSRQGMMAKNRMFQEVLGEYARGATATNVPEAANLEGAERPDVVLQATSDPQSESAGGGTDAGGGIPGVEVADDRDGVVIQE